MSQSPIKEVLQTLSRNSGTIEHALGGVISMESGTPASAISALRQASALRPAGEEGYRLHPKLREFLQDHLQLFPAFQQLADIGLRISHMRSMWTEIELSMQTGDRDSVQSAMDALYTSAFDIIHSMDLNMLLLQTLMSTRYGNVRSLEAKKGQNRFYQAQASNLAGDLQRLGKVADEIEKDAAIRGVEDLSRFLRRNILGRLLEWQQSMSEIQTLIRKDIFRTRQIERSMRQLARTDMLLRQQPAWRGIEADLSGDIPVFLLATRLPPLRPLTEPLDTDRAMRQEMASLVQSLPPKTPAGKEDAAPTRYKRIVDPPKPLEISPAARALARLSHAVANSPKGVSLIDWAQQDEDASTLEPPVWLVFALMGLRSLQMHVQVVRNLPREGERFSHTFRDAIAYPEPPAEALAA